ncbi:putative nuclear pore protein [Viridothelium virens]|uniref:Putative nuclear pore protein n=1 Tax=Viridothelium virens TaxID=1048519 RepID=A0A6A6HHL9_VIRVR|nr:putative nuclear pore protein [Viridothelium virens]
MATAFDHGHKDLVLAIDYNLYGNRMVTASSDHTLRVWDKEGDAWELMDSWKAHDAEVTDVKWNGPFSGEMLASIGEDGIFKVWEEDPLERPNSHKRFRRMYQLWSPTKVPFMSLDFKDIGADTFVALITRDGYLMICEPVDSDDFRDWQVLTQMYVCPTPPRTDETSFRVSFHHEKLPGWHAIAAGLDRKSLGLAVAAMDKVIVYRTDRERQLYIAAELLGARGLVRDVAWANGAMRGFDVIATASKDGAVRVYELTTPMRSESTPTSSEKDLDSPRTSSEIPRSKEQRRAQSGIGAGLAGSPQPNLTGQGSSGDRSRIKHDVKLVSELHEHEGAVWRVGFSPMGDVLISSGDDGKIRTWKRAFDASNGTAEWIEYSVVGTRPDEEETPYEE